MHDIVNGSYVVVASGKFRDKMTFLQWLVPSGL